MSATDLPAPIAAALRRQHEQPPRRYHDWAHAERVVALVRSEGGRLRVKPDNVLEYQAASYPAAARAQTARDLLQRLAE